MIGDDIRLPLIEEEKQILDKKTERLNISIALVLGKRIVAGGLS